MSGQEVSRAPQELCQNEISKALSILEGIFMRHRIERSWGKKEL